MLVTDKAREGMGPRATGETKVALEAGGRTDSHPVD